MRDGAWCAFDGHAKPHRRCQQQPAAAPSSSQPTNQPTTTEQVNLQNLKDRQRWASGWLQKDEMRALEAERASAADGGGGGAAAEARSGAACKGCTGTGRVPCPLCSRAGQVVEL